MIVTVKMARDADLQAFVTLLREQAEWHDEESVSWLLLTRAANEIERLGKRRGHP